MTARQHGVVPDPRDEPTVDVERAGSWFGLGRSKAYEEARRYVASGGQEGLPVLVFGRTLRAPVARIRELLGLPATETNEGPGSDAQAFNSDHAPDKEASPDEPTPPRLRRVR